MKTSRRDFIKISSLSLGGILAINPLINMAMDSDNNLQDDDKIKRFPTYCEVCFWKCAGWVHTKNDKIWKITGNKEDQHSNGRFCPRGTGGLGMYYDKDRLKKPLKRIEENGKQIFVEITWDEAFDFIAEKLQKIKKKYGAECVALFTHGSGGKFWGHLLKAYGSTNISAPSYSQCRGPREAGFIATYGKGIGSPEPLDIKNTKCMVLIGSHLGENMHNGQVQEMSQALEKGASLITVDPRYSTVASKSKFWLPIKPATDIALLLAWIHEIIYKEYYDKKYVEKYTYGFEDLKVHVKNFTPEWAYGKTTIKPDIIRKTAKEMSNASPSVIINPGRHVTWYGDDTQRLRCVAILNALLGSYGKKGGIYSPEKYKVPKFPSKKYIKPKRNWRQAFPGKFKLAKLVLASGICDATIPTAERDCSFKAWIVNGTNLITTLPNQANTLKAIKSLELLVVIDTMPAEITGYADIILPECTYLERYDMLRVAKHRKPAIALRMPATEPLYDSKPGWWMARELGLKMGLKEYFKYENITELLEWQLKKIGSSLEEMKKIGVKTFERKEPLFYGEDEDIEFNTNTGKIELYSTVIEEIGFDPMPKYLAHPEPEEGFYRLNYGRAPMHTFGRTANNPNLFDLMEENKIWVNPKVAKEWDLKTGQEVWLKNQDGVIGSNSIKVRVTERIRWDSVYLVHGFGSTSDKLSRAYKKGLSDSELITNIMMDPIMGGTGMRGNFVTFLLKEPKNNKS
ncbi:MAG: nitrate reductase [Bacteroidetes bacterium 4572_128]|nr:MAG: nitrate reductase [Bacteroidetes bacterium 4572_128]